MMADDHLHAAEFRQRNRRPGAEYWLYFSVIFVLALPAALVKWLAAMPRSDAPNPGVLSRAMSEARTITPIIFSA